MAPNLKIQSGPLPFPWAEFISRSGISPASAAFSWKGGSQTAMILDFNFGDVVNPSALLSGALQSILGYADYILPGVGGINYIGGAAPTTITVVATTFPDESGSGGTNWTAYNGTWVMTQSGGTQWLATAGGISVALIPSPLPAPGQLLLQFSGGPGGVVQYAATFAANSPIGPPFDLLLALPGNPELPFQMTAIPSGGSGGLITRTLPLQHPMFPQLWATRVSKVEYYGPNQKQGSSNNLIPYMGWRDARVYVLFEAVPWTLLTDTQLATQYGGDEAFRFVDGPYHNGSMHGLQRQPQSTGGFRWVNGPISGTPINFGLTQLLFTAVVSFTWMCIPEVALYGPNRMQGGWPAPAFAIAGLVNSAQYLQYPAGTLLGRPGKIVQVPSPFPLNSYTQYPQRLFNVEFEMSYRPPPALWNRVPFAGDGQWYDVRIPPGGSNDPTNGTPLFYSIDYNKVLFVPATGIPSATQF